MSLIAAGSARAEPLKPIVSHEGWAIDLTGYVQVDSVAWSQDSVDQLDPSTGLPLNQTRFLIRRGRLRADVHRDALFGAIELDGNTVNGAVARLLAAQVGWKYPATDRAPLVAPLVAVTAGLFKVPFGAEVPARERDKPFLEPPTWATALFAGNYDAGAMASGAYELLRWSLAVTNGSPVGDAQWTGKDPSSSYDVIGRIGADIPAPRHARVIAGFSALSGTGLHAGTPPTKDDIQWVDENGNGRVDPIELTVIPGKPGTPSVPFHRNALGADLAVRWCLNHLGAGVGFFEGALATNLDRAVVYADPIAQARDLRELGFAAGVVQSIGDHAVVGVRYDRYEADRDASERAGVELVQVHKEFSTLGIMASARWSTARFILQYDHQRNPFGRADDGSPITRSADRVTLRAQVGF